MQTLQTIFDGLNGIASTYFSNTNNGIRQNMLQQQNQALVNQLNQNQGNRNLTTIITLAVAAVSLVLIIKNK